MKNKLRNIHIDEGSLVNRGANQLAEIMLFKNHSDLERGDNMDDIDKVGAKLNSRSKGIIRQAIDTLMGIDGLEDLIATETKKGEFMSETEIPEDVQKRIDELQAEADKVNDLTTQVEELTKQLAEQNEETEDVLKGASDEVQKAMADIRKELEEAKAEASQANEAMLTKKFEDMAADIHGDVASMLRKAHDAGFGDELVTTLKSMTEQIKANDLMTKELGSANETENDATVQLQSLAKAHAKDNDMTFEQAYVAVLRSDEGKRIYSEGGVN